MRQRILEPDDQAQRHTEKRLGVKTRRDLDQQHGRLSRGQAQQPIDAVSGETVLSPDVRGVMVDASAAISASIQGRRIKLALNPTAADFMEAVRDVVGAVLVAGNNVDITVSDAGDTVTIDVEALTEADIASLVSDLALKAPLASPTFTGTVTAADVTTTGNSTLGNSDGDLVTVRQVKSAGTSPAIANGAAAGTSPGAAAIEGTDRCGLITITTGTATTTGTLCTITFAATKGSSKFAIFLFPSDPSAMNAMANVRANPSSTSQWTITVTGAAIATSADHLWWYMVEEYEP